jgi:hypothetical protein
MSSSTCLLTHSMEQSPFWEANRFAASPEIPRNFGTRRFITAFTSARHKCLSQLNPVHTPHPTSWRSALMWVPVTTAWRVLRLRMEERPPMWREAANILNKQSRTADKGWSCSLDGWANGHQLLAMKMCIWYEIFANKASDMDWYFNTT